VELWHRALGSQPWLPSFEEQQGVVPDLKKWAAASLHASCVLSMANSEQEAKGLAVL
jgi:hypothetical protein